MKATKKIIASLCLLFFLCLTNQFVPISITSYAADAVTLDVSDGSINITTTGYSIGGGAETKFTGDYVITGTAKNTTININGNHNILLDSLTLDNAGYSWGIMIYSGTVDLMFKGENTVTAGGIGGDFVPIGVQAPSTLILSGADGNDSILNVVGTSDGKAAIGGAWDQFKCGNIIINSGTINAKGGGNGAAVIGTGGNGSMASSSCKITINGGNINCEFINERGVTSAIGGRDMTVEINDGVVDTNGGVIDTSNSENWKGTVNGKNYGSKISYTITIPASVALGQTAEIKAENVNLDDNQQVKVTLSATNESDNTFKVTSDEGAVLEYTVSNNNQNVEVGDTVLAMNAEGTKSTILNFRKPDSESVQYSGNYNGTLEFNISIENKDTKAV